MFFIFLIYLKLILNRKMVDYAIIYKKIYTLADTDNN